MSKLTGAICLLLVSVFISSVSQILLKKAADRTYENHLREYLNPLVIFSYGDPDHAGTEKSSPFHAADPGIYRIHFCGCDGVYFSEGKTEQKKIGRNRTDPCWDHCVFTVEKELYGLSDRSG